MQRCQLSDKLGFLVYGRLLCYGERIFPREITRSERKRAERSNAVTRGASTPHHHRQCRCRWLCRRPSASVPPHFFAENAIKQRQETSQLKPIGTGALRHCHSFYCRVEGLNLTQNWTCLGLRWRRERNKQSQRLEHVAKPKNMKAQCCATEYSFGRVPASGCYERTKQSPPAVKPVFLRWVHLAN